MKHSKSDKTIIQKDLLRYGFLQKGHRIRFIRAFRSAQESSIGIIRHYYRLKCKIYEAIYGLEIPVETQIGEGFVLNHAFNITINPSAIIGKNCTIHKGVLIGSENRGFRKGSPVIGNNVWIGTNAVIVGNVHIGDDVLIAPNSYVNCNVPSHSIVLGSPCIIRHKENATEGYILFTNESSI